MDLLVPTAGTKNCVPELYWNKFAVELSVYDDGGRCDRVREDLEDWLLIRLFSMYG